MLFLINNKTWVIDILDNKPNNIDLDLNHFPNKINIIINNYKNKSLIIKSEIKCIR